MGKTTIPKEDFTRRLLMEKRRKKKRKAIQESEEYRKDKAYLSYQFRKI